MIKNLDKISLPFDQYSRYFVSSEIIKKLFKNRTVKILDVGGLSRLWHTEETFCLMNLFLPENHTFTMDSNWNNESGFVQANGLKIPFKDSTFQAVCALDVLEHIEKKERIYFLNEIFRVSSDLVILSFPFLSSTTRKAERLLKDYIKKVLSVDHAELKDHSARGLPQFQSTLEEIKKLSQETFYFSMGNIENWLFFMTLRYSFMHKLSWVFINRFFDVYFNTHYYETEFQEPCYRILIVSTKKEPIRDFLEIKDHYSRINKKISKPKINLETFKLFGHHLERAFTDFRPSLPSDVTLSVIVVTYDSEEYIKKCLSFLKRLTPRLTRELFIVDNASHNFHPKKIKKIFPQATIKINEKNFGYAKAANLAILGAKGRYILLLNPDCSVNSNEIIKLIDYMEANPQVGIVGPQILNQDGSVQGTARKFPDAWTALFGRTTLLSRIFPQNKFTRKNIFASKEIKKPTEVDWISGALMLVRKKAVSDVGLMDENFFLYWEDADWCMRFRKQGWKVVYYPFAQAVHSIGGSSKKRKLKSIIDFHKSAYRHYRKYNIKKGNLLKKLFALTGLSVRALVLIIFHTLFPEKKEIQKTKKKNLNILHLVHNYHPAKGGVENLMQNISERLQKRGHKVKVIASNALSVEDYIFPKNNKKLTPVGKDVINGVEVERIPFSTKNQALWNYFFKLSWYLKLPGNSWIRAFRQGPRTKEYVEAGLNFPCDLICSCPLPTMNVYYAHLLKKKKKCPLVIIPCIHTEDRPGYHNKLFYKILKKSDAIIALTSLEKHFLIKAGVSPRKIFVSGVGIEENLSDNKVDIRKKYGIKEQNVVLFVGQHGVHKGINCLIKAMDYVWQKKKDTGLIIAGSPTAHSKNIVKLIHEYPRKKRKKIFRIDSFSEEEKNAIYKSADVFVSVSKYESFGIVYLEAWLNKIPVISCRTGASSTVVNNFQDGLQVEFNNPVELGMAILELLNDKATAKKMGETGYRKVKKNYTWPHVIDKIEEVYRTV